MSSDLPEPVPTGLPCPRCRVDLVMSERAGIEIDYCPKCRGVWLDRGELDKILERSTTQTFEAPVAGPAEAPPMPQAPSMPQAGPWGGQAPAYPAPPQPGWGTGHGGGHGGGLGGGKHGGYGGHGSAQGGYRRKSWLREIFD